MSRKKIVTKENIFWKKTYHVVDDESMFESLSSSFGSTIIEFVKKAAIWVIIVAGYAWIASMIAHFLTSLLHLRDIDSYRLVIKGVEGYYGQMISNFFYHFVTSFVFIELILVIFYILFYILKNSKVTKRWLMITQMITIVICSIIGITFNLSAHVLTLEEVAQSTTKEMVFTNVKGQKTDIKLHKMNASIQYSRNSEHEALIKYKYEKNVQMTIGIDPSKIYKNTDENYYFKMTSLKLQNKSENINFDKNSKEMKNAQLIIYPLPKGEK